MLQKSLTVLSSNGLHAQASAKIVQVLSGFNCKISFTLGARVVNAKSIMGVMLLAAGPGKIIVAQADGADAELALNALEQLFQNHFAE